MGLAAALAGLVAVAAAAACGDGGPGERLFSPQGNQLDVYELDSDSERTLLIPATRNTVNGQACLLPDGDGRFLLGEDTGQDEGQRQGWGIFTKDGMLETKILEPESEGEAEQPEPFGCGFDAEDRLFTTDVGSGEFDSTDGKLMVFFPPDYQQSCILERELRVAGTIAIDGGNVYVTETVPPGRVLRYSGSFPAAADQCESTTPERSTFIEDPDVQTPFGITKASNGNWYLSSVFLPTAIREYDADGEFVRTIVEGEDAGNPAGLAVGSDGTLYYADLGLVQEPGQLPAPGDNAGTVRRVAFDENGEPQAPEVIAEGLDYPDAVTVVGE